MWACGVYGEDNNVAEFKTINNPLGPLDIAASTNINNNEPLTRQLLELCTPLEKKNTQLIETLNEDKKDEKDDHNRKQK